MHECISSTAYNAYINHIQYDTYNNQSACLVGIDVAFRFPSKRFSLFPSAEIKATFEKALRIFKRSV